MNVTILTGKAWGKHHITLFVTLGVKVFFFFLSLLLSLSSLQALINQTEFNKFL